MNEAKTEQEYESQPLKNFAMLMFVFRETTSLSSEDEHKHDSFVKCCNSYLLFCFLLQYSVWLIAIEQQLPTQLSAADFRPFYAKSCTLPHFMLLLSSIVYAII